MKEIKPNQLVYAKEGEGIVRTMQIDHAEGRLLKLLTASSKVTDHWWLDGNAASCLAWPAARCERSMCAI
jgi:hypothetical protein